jgi:site-specific recombinase XerD
MENMDIHGIEQSYKAGIAKLMASDDANRDAIMEFIDFCKAKGIGKKRMVKYIYTLMNISQMLGKPFKEAGKQDIIRFLGRIEEHGFSEWTKHDYRVIVKRLYKWLEGGDSKYPEKVEWIKTTVRNGDHVLPEEILTEEEIFSMAKTGDNLKHKALLMTLYESGARIEEFLTLTNKRVQFDDNGCVVILSGKTGMRRIRLISSAPVLKTYLEAHPLKDEKEFPLWVAASGDRFVPLSYAGCSMLLQRIAEKAGIGKKVNPHAFRHARATHLSKILTYSQLCAFFGWSQGSQMPATYIHLSGADIDNTLLSSQGLKPIDNKAQTLFVRVCPSCREKNSPLSSICVSCGEPLTSSEEMKKRIEELERTVKLLQPYMELVRGQNSVADRITGSRLNEELDNHIRKGTPLRQ